MKKIWGAASAAVIASLLVAGNANAALVNGSFESPDASGGDVACSDDWECFNSNFTTSNNFMPGGGFVNPGAFDGTQVLKQFGGDGGAFQAIDAVAGQAYEASAQVISYVGDPFNNLALLQLAFFDASGNNLGVVETFCDSIGAQDCTLTPATGEFASDWTLMSASGVAPDGTASAQILLLHILTDGTPGSGSVFWDDANLQAVPVPAAVWLFGSAFLGLIGFARRRLP